MPKISRFFGIIIRMFVEAGPPIIHLTSMPIIKIGLAYTELKPSSGSPADFPTGKNASFSRGQNCIRMNC